MTCANCNKEIHSSYGPTDADYRDMIRDWHHQITKRDPSAGVLEDILQYVKDEEENEGGPNDMRGNYHSVGVFVREFIDNDAKSHEKPVGRRQMANRGSAGMSAACPICGEQLLKYGAPNSPEFGRCSQHGEFKIRSRRR